MEELTKKIQRSTKSLKTSHKKQVQERMRANALEARLEELAQLLQIITNSRDGLREDVLNLNQTIAIQTQEREEQHVKFSASLSEKTDLINRLHQIINEQKKQNHQHELTEQQQQARITELNEQNSTSTSLIENLRRQINK